MHGMIILGPAGSGKTTLGKFVADKMEIAFLDIDEYIWRNDTEKPYEIGFHLRPKFWGQGFATEAATAVMEYACTSLGAERLFAGHHPDNKASQKVLGKLGFQYTGDEFYEPTGLYHPSYEWKRKE